MNSKRLYLIAFSTSLLINFIASQARAIPLALNEASIDSVSFNFTGSSFLGRSSNAYSRVELTPVDGIANDQQTASGSSMTYLDTAAAAANAHEQAIATTSDNSSVYSFARAYGEGNAFAEDFQNLEFTALTPGTFTVSLNYTLQQLLETDMLKEGAWGSTEAHLRLFKLGTDIFHQAEEQQTEAQIDNTLINGGTIRKTQTGVLNVSLDFAAGDSGRFDYFTTVRSHARANVPEPSTLVLLGTGLISLAGIRRRKFLK